MESEAGFFSWLNQICQRSSSPTPTLDVMLAVQPWVALQFRSDSWGWWATSGKEGGTKKVAVWVS